MLVAHQLIKHIHWQFGKYINLSYRISIWYYLIFSQLNLGIRAFTHVLMNFEDVAKEERMTSSDIEIDDGSKDYHLYRSWREEEPKMMWDLGQEKL